MQPSSIFGGESDKNVRDETLKLTFEQYGIFKKMTEKDKLLNYNKFGVPSLITKTK